MEKVTIDDADSVAEAKVTPTTNSLLDCTNKNITCTGRNEEEIVHLSDHQEDSVVDLDDGSP